MRSVLIPSPGSFPLRSGSWGPCWLLSMGKVSWFHQGLLGAAISPDIRVLSTTVVGPITASSPGVLPSGYGQNLDHWSSSPDPVVFTGGLCEVGLHCHILWFPHPHPPQELTQHTPSGAGDLCVQTRSSCAKVTSSWRSFPSTSLAFQPTSAADVSHFPMAL